MSDARRPRTTLGCTELEDRVVPNAYFWSGGGSNKLWSNAANWSAGAKPNTGDSSVRVYFYDYVGDSVQDIPGLLLDRLVFGTSTDTADSNVNLAINTVTILNGTYDTASNVYDGTGKSRLTGQAAVTLSSSVTFELPSATSPFQVAIPVVGSGGVVKQGGGELRFTGTASNTYTGATNIQDGTVSLFGDTADASVSKVVYIGDGSGAGNSARLYVNADYVVPDAASVYVAADGILQLGDGHSEDFKVLDLGGNAYVGTGGVLGLRADGVLQNYTGTAGLVYGSGSLQFYNGTAVIDTPVNFAGPAVTVDVPVVGSAANVRKAGPGRVKFTKTLGTTGTTQIDGGSFVFPGTAPAGDITLFAGSATSLGVVGTPGADTLQFSPGGAYQNVVANGKALKVTGPTAANIALYGEAGADTVIVAAGGAGAVTAANIFPGVMYMAGTGFAVSGAAESITLFGRPQDAATLTDSAGADTYVATPQYAFLQGAGFYEGATGFGSVSAFSTSGGDAAYLYDSAGDDVYVATPQYALVQGTGFYRGAVGFGTVNAYASTGTDAAYLTGSAGNDVFVSGTGYALMQGIGFFRGAVGFDGVNAAGGGGTDAAYLADSAGNDTFSASGSYASMAGTGYFIGLDGFAGVTATSSAGGSDRKFVGSVGFYVGLPGNWF